MMVKHYLYFLLGGMAVIASCSNDKKDASLQAVTAGAGSSAAKKGALMAPFRYHKSVEVAPGLTYDVLSWGRGTDSVGAFQILRSDSAERKYTTTTGDLEGRIVDVINSDMDTDGNPEIFIHTQAADSTNKAVVYGFEYNDDNARKLEFPKLTRSQRKGYRGNDNFFVKDGKLMREFDVYNEDDSTATKPIQKRLLAYDLRGNSISVEQISKDTTLADNKASAQPIASPAEKPKAEEPKHRSSSRHRERTSSRRSSSRKRQTSHKKETHSKKRRRHR
ncbi:hypothetical protein [Mucilaginibacter lacusdianchii]|uniref:hypothetical protein n=1 Tax=Mucilaginibacter lacusdianchii TaxID=2684211 RepID=UPI00131A99D3|nr:hypothetical protein [Mucilaginibacter sp. JXJ CY 39]